VTIFTSRRDARRDGDGDDVVTHAGEVTRLDGDVTAT
jgi:hypothetical protein